MPKHPLTQAVQQNVTLGIKTLWRPKCLNRLLTSIRKQYPDIPIVCVDDSKEDSVKDPTAWGNFEYIRLPFDTGLGPGRNVMIDAIKTPYTVYLDDDYVFIPGTKLERFYAILEGDHCDLIGGRCKEGKHIRNYHGTLKRKGDVMHYYRNFHHKTSFVHTDVDGEDVALTVGSCDIVVNFFMARTDLLQQVRWSDDLKINTHSEFFWRAHKQMRVAYTGSVTIGHRAERHKEYNKLRHRRHINKAMELHGIKRLVRHGSWR